MNKSECLMGIPQWVSHGPLAKDASVVRYSILNRNDQPVRRVLPSEDESRTALDQGVLCLSSVSRLMMGAAIAESNGKTAF